jgi:hypothetical protein
VGKEADPLSQDRVDRDPVSLVIECFYTPQCPSLEVLPERLARALAEEGVQAEVRHKILSVEEAQQRGIGGSPTVWINNVDILDAPSGAGT